MPRGAGRVEESVDDALQPKNQAAELSPGAGLIFCAFSRFTGLGVEVEALLPLKTGTASLLIPWDTLVFCRDILSAFERHVFSLWSKKYRGHSNHKNKCVDLQVSTADKVGKKVG